MTVVIGSVPTMQSRLNRKEVESRLKEEGAAILPPMDVKDALREVASFGLGVTTTILDPWYNKGIGGVREDYRDFILDVLAISAEVSDHVFLWGFPEILAPFVERIPSPLRLVCWLTWYYKNSPSVIRGWRSSQNACLHLCRPEAKLYPEHFMNAAQKAKQSEGKLRYMPGPTSVIEESLLCGFVGKNEQMGHPAQKPVAVFEKLILMTTKEGDIVLDPMCGAGTAGEAARRSGRLAILSDSSEEYTKLAEDRLGISRIGSKDGRSGKVRSNPRTGKGGPPGGLFG